MNLLRYGWNGHREIEIKERPLVIPQEKGAKKAIPSYGPKEDTAGVERLSERMMELVPAMVIAGVE